MVRNGGGQNFDELLALAVMFSEDVSASLDELADKFDLTLVNTSTATPVDLTAAVLSYNGSTNTATSDLTSATIDFGFHMATLSAAGIADQSGNSLDGDGDGNTGDDFLATVPERMSTWYSPN